MSPLQSLIVNDCEGMAACAMKNMQRLAYDSLRMSAGVGPKVTFQNTLPNLSISTQLTKKLKFGKLSPEWQPSAFSKYFTKYICFHTGQKRMEN